MAREGHALPCEVCGLLFETLSAFDAHLPCKRPTKWGEPKFLEHGRQHGRTENPTFRPAEFIDPEFGDPGGARWAGETTRDRVDSHLRTRRIRALTWEAPPVEKKSIWKKVYEWLMK